MYFLVVTIDTHTENENLIALIYRQTQSNALHFTFINYLSDQ